MTQQDREAFEELEQKLLRAIERGSYTEATPEFWKRVRAFADEKAEADK
jgi:hypothetical protein